MSSFAFDIVHVDLSGPCRVPTHDGKRFFMALMDDFSRFTWTVLMKNKFVVVVVL